MQKLEVDETSKKNRKTKYELKKDVEKSTTKGERETKTEIQEKVNKC